MNAISVSLATTQLIDDMSRCKRAGIAYGPRFLRVAAATLGSMGLICGLIIGYAANAKSNPFAAYVCAFFALLAVVGAVVLLVLWSVADKKRLDALIADREAAACRSAAAATDIL